MPSLPDAIVSLLSPFASLFDARIWRKVQILLAGVILAPGRRTVTAALYALGLQAEGDWVRYHHVLSRASWSSLEVSRVLLAELVQHLAPTGPLHLVIDEALERCWGAKIEALGVYRDPVRSSHGHFVKAKGLRWVSLMLLAEVSWARRVWALPFLTVLAPSRHYHEARGRRHKTITDWARQMLCLLRRWLPDRDLVVVADRTYATLKLLAACQALTPPITFLTRLRLDAVLHDPRPPRRPGQKGRPRIVGARQPSLQAVLADTPPDRTDVDLYACRHWIEQGFRGLKRGGWQWHRTRRRDPVRVARHLLALAVATLLAVAYGTRHEEARLRGLRPGQLRRPPAKARPPPVGAVSACCGRARPACGACWSATASGPGSG